MVLHMIINTTAVKMELTFSLIAFVLLVRVPETRQNLTGVHLENGNSIGKEQTVVENIKL